MLSRLMYGATWETKKPLVALVAAPEADLVVMDVPLQVSVALGERMRAWSREVSAQTPVLVLRANESAFGTESEEPTSTWAMAAKPARGSRLRERAEALVPCGWKRDPALDLIDEERLACAWWTAERCGLSARELALVAAAIS
ncbi:MAG: hypothetical protein KC586_14395, partial [Myxococcales bacterium]|nr:hypothetical protein [Myxococcales bacterium]